jgi:hypothetical protein
MEMAQPQPQHRWLEQWLGDWSFEVAAKGPPGQPEERSTGREHVRSLGGLWVVCEGRGTMPGDGEATTLMTVGFDPGRGRFVGTWCGSMMTHLWIYDGELDAAGRVLTLAAQGPSFTGQGTANYRDAVEVVSRDERILRSSVQGEDGAWHAFMTARYRRER